MGRLHYDGERFEFDDRLLAHLQIVIGSKLRRGESFFLSWTMKGDSGSGRHSIWIDAGVPIHIVCFGARLPTINRQWVEELANGANSTSGLVLTDEPTEAEHQLYRRPSEF